MARKKRDETTADGPEVAERREPTPGTRGRKPGRRSNASIEKEIREQFTAFLGVSAMMWSTRDEVCSAALAENSEALAAGLAHFCAKSKYARKIALGMTDTSVLLPFAMAVVRFGSVVYAHHSPAVEPAYPEFSHEPVDLTGRAGDPARPVV